jgi:hypothetical protein
LQPQLISNSDSGYKGSHSRQSFYLLLLCYLNTFFFPSTLQLDQERLALYAMTLNDERKVTLSFSPSCPSRLTFGICVITTFFLGRSNEVATDIGFLAPGLDGHVFKHRQPTHLFLIP